jgi:hypothetical protein
LKRCVELSGRAIRTRIPVLAFFLSMMYAVSAQIPMPLMNPSFEEMSIPGVTVERSPNEIVPSWVSWSEGKSAGEDLPAVRHNDDVTKYVHQTTRNGDAYLELAVHKNNTWHSIGQELQEPLTGGKHYSMSLYACLDPGHAARTQVQGERGVNQGMPVILRIRGANKFGEPGRVLAQTDPITTIDWSMYFLDLYPKENYRYLVIEAYRVPGITRLYEARVLIDNAKLGKYL